MQLIFKPQAWEDLEYWKKQNPKIVSRILKLLEDICRDNSRVVPTGLGKPEALKYGLSGCWSRRIDRTHRLVYQIEANTIVVLQCRFHYA